MNESYHVDQLDDEYIDGDDDNTSSSEDEGSDFIHILDVFSTWFIRIGLAIGVILLIYYIVVGNIFSALLFILGMAVAYAFGYFFMYCIDKFMSA